MKTYKILTRIIFVISLFVSVQIFSATTVKDFGVKSTNFICTDLKTPTVLRSSYDYSLTITQSMRLDINAVLYPVTETIVNKDLHIYLSKDNVVIYNLPYVFNQSQGTFSLAYQTGYLQPGTYTITSNSYGTKEEFDFEISGILKGDTFDGAISLGNFSGNFSCSDTKNTSGFANDNGLLMKDVYYKFTLNSTMDVTISHCGSEVADTYLYLLDSSGKLIASNDNYSGEGQCSSTTNAFLKMPNLAPGTYYVVSEGNTQDGNITTSVQGRKPLSEVLKSANSLGSFSGDFSCSDTKNTVNTFDCYGLSTNDIFYKLTLNHQMDVTISHCGSAVTDTYLYLLDSSGKLITSNDNYSGEGQCSSITNAYLKMTDLAAGTYYIVSEGNLQNGNITTTVNGKMPFAGFDTGQNQNYILEITPTVESSNVRDLSLSQCIQKIQYYDGLGRPSQTVHRGFSLNNNDLVALQEYDNQGRESNLWLPTPYSASGSYTDPTTIIATSKTSYADNSPYSSPVYEASPLNRVLQQYGPGVNWRTAGASVKSAFYTNNNNLDSLKCAYYYVTSDNKLVKSDDDYDNGQLYVTRTMDEDGHEVFEFKDKQGQVILIRQKNGGEYYDTYYVYDDFGNKCFVLPPSVTSGLKDGVGLDNVLQRFGYIYQYDSRNRCIYKKLPGADPIYMIYDKADRLIFSQDGEQRKKMPQEWSFNIPDVFGRTVLTGICKNSLTYMDDPLKDIVVKSDTISNVYKGYNVNISLLSSTVLTANYYDGYGFMLRYGGPLMSDSNFSMDTNTGYGERYTGGYKGLLTGKATALLDGSSYLYNVMYYDYMGRVIQTKATNHLTGGYDKNYFLYTFTGKVKKHQHMQSASGKATITEVYENFYDNAERLTKTTHSLNGSIPITLAENTYDNIGRLNSKKQHVTEGTTTSAETTSYTYNIRSWLKSINTAKNRFSETLYYNESSNGSIKYYNGNIGAMNWIVQNDAQRGYNFHYDDLNRITAADYQNNDANTDKNYTTTYAYDNMGNIKSLTRYGLSAKPSTFGMIDTLTLNYNGNQLSSVTDVSTNEPSYSGAFNFVKASVGTPEYTYDANGNLTRDSHKKIAKIQYNILNLPSALQFTEGHTSEYLYDAAGVKRKVKQVTTTENLLVPMGSMLPVPADKVAVTTQTDYCGNVIYENGALSRILVDGGYITMSGTTPTYHYYIQDHQGNNRVVFNQSGTIEQTNHYYPFGMTFGEGIGNSDNRYKYNGKELDRMHGLDLYDYGARHLDAAIGRWGAMDPLAEKRYSISPYAYCSNNPITHIDPTGMLDDDYFNYDGEYLGTDNSTTSFNIKIVDEGTWNRSISSEGIIDHESGEFISSLLSNSKISDKAILNVFQHYNPTDLPLEKAASGSFKPGQTGMITGSSKTGKDYSIKCDILGLKESGSSDRAMEIRNLFSHEKGHVDDVKELGLHGYNRTNPIIREQVPIYRQMNDPSFSHVSPGFIKSIITYAKENAMSFPVLAIPKINIPIKIN